MGTILVIKSFTRDKDNTNTIWKLTISSAKYLHFPNTCLRIVVSYRWLQSCGSWAWRRCTWFWLHQCFICRCKYFLRTHSITTILWMYFHILYYVCIQKQVAVLCKGSTPFMTCLCKSQKGESEYIFSYWGTHGYAFHPSKDHVIQIPRDFFRVRYFQLRCYRVLHKIVPFWLKTVDFKFQMGYVSAIRWAINMNSFQSLTFKLSLRNFLTDSLIRLRSFE